MINKPSFTTQRLFITIRNEVAKVMFLQACVCPRGGGERVPDQAHHPRDTATAADGTHPAGMHSCLK